MITREILHRIKEGELKGVGVEEEDEDQGGVEEDAVAVVEDVVTSLPTLAQTVMTMNYCRQLGHTPRA